MKNLSNLLSSKSWTCSQLRLKHSPFSPFHSMINLLVFEGIEIITFLTGILIGFCLLIFLQKFRYTSTLSVLSELQKSMSNSKIFDDIEDFKHLIQKKVKP